MKKFLSILLAASMAFSCSGLVYGADGEIIEEFFCDFDTDTDGMEYYVTIKEISGQTVKMDIEYITANLSHLYTAENITGSLSGNTVEFTWEDSWLNSGTGSLVIYNGSADLKIVVTKESDFNFNTLATGDRPTANSDGSIPLTSTKNAGAAYALINSSASSAAVSDSIGIYLNGEVLSFPQEPYIEDGTTMVPMRAIFEALGAEVIWDSDSRTITASKNETEIVLTIDSTTAYINGTGSELLKAPVIKDGSTMVPLRFVSEALDCQVDYDSAAKNINISSL